MKWRNPLAIVCLGVGVVAQGCAQVLGFDETRDFGVPCATSADCPGIDDACKTRICVSGTCAVDLAAAGKPCEQTNFCDGAGQCKLGPGLGCFMDTQCSSGFCVDDVCCNSACSGSCEACSSDTGVCTPFAKDTDPDDECMNGVCNGLSACEYDNGEACTVEKDCTSGICFAGSCCPEVCAQGASCETGVCQCPGTTPLICGDVCKDGASDNDHCGTCGKTCDLTKNEDCLNGTCEDLAWAQWPIPNAAPSPSDYDVDATNGVVVDKVTKLMWQREVDPAARNWVDAKAYCNNSMHAGHDDWRLPTRMELVSIVDYTKINPAIDASAFPNTPSNGFWTSSPLAGSASAAWVVGFGNGGSNYGAVTGTYRARCVR